MRFNYEGAEGVIHLTVKETEQFLSGKAIERLIKIVSKGGDFTVTLCLKELDKIDE
jgi:thiamine biosynthesis protein ThiC